MNERSTLFAEAEFFIKQCYAELNLTEEAAELRLKEIADEIEQSGTYSHTYEELRHGARMAWRNSNRCIGRLPWDSLHVVDKRNASSEEEIAAALLEHLDYATNRGRIRPTITILRPEQGELPGARVWNEQLIRYAGYAREDGSRIGDPASLEFTVICEQLGWQGRGTDFDVLPLVIQLDGRAPKWFEVPREHVLEVDIRHSELAGFNELGLKWYAVPAVSNMRLEIGGIRYSGAPFNGWYMGTEIGARNLADEGRYNLLPVVADLMGIDRSRRSTLWQDRALVELNVAVLESYRAAGVSMVDHHTAAAQFERFEKREREAGRDVTGNWAWLIPPMAPATTHVFHKRYDNTIVKPNFFYGKKPYVDLLEETETHQTDPSAPTGSCPVTGARAQVGSFAAKPLSNVAEQRQEVPSENEAYAAEARGGCPFH